MSVCGQKPACAFCQETETQNMEELISGTGAGGKTTLFVYSHFVKQCLVPTELHAPSHHLLLHLSRISRISPCDFHGTADWVGGCR